MAREPRHNSSRQRKTEYANTLRATTPCADCGVRYPYFIMEFDHARGEKVKNVMVMAGSGSWKQLFAEIAKCDIVCANCHAARTHYRRVAPNGSTNN